VFATNNLFAFFFFLLFVWFHHCLPSLFSAFWSNFGFGGWLSFFLALFFFILACSVAFVFSPSSGTFHLGTALSSDGFPLSQRVVQY